MLARMEWLESYILMAGVRNGTTLGKYSVVSYKHTSILWPKNSNPKQSLKGNETYVHTKTWPRVFKDVLIHPNLELKTTQTSILVE